MAIDPLWRRAPLVLRDHVGAGLAVAAAVGVLTVATASAPLLVSSAGAAAFERLRSADPRGATGLVAIGEGPATTDGIDGVDALLRTEIARLDGLTAPVASLAGMQFQRTPETSGVVVGGDVVTATLVHRDGLLPSLRAQAGGGDGLWLPSTLAEAADVAPGGTVRLVGTADDDGSRIELDAEVAGAYGDPFDDGLLRPDASDVWRDVLAGLPRSEESTRVPPLLLADRATFLDLAGALDERVLARWESSLTVDATSLVGARTLVADLGAFLGAATDPTGDMVATISGFARPGEFSFDTGLPRTVEQATAVADTLQGPLRSLAIAAQVVALLLVAAAVAMLLRRRHLELRLLAAQGASPVTTGARVALEVLPAAVAGAVAGWLLAAPVVRVLGPSPQLDPTMVGAARGAMMTSLVAALVVTGTIGAVSAAGAPDLGTPSSGTRLRWVPWEPVALALAIAAGYQLLVRSDAARVEAGTVDLLVVAFPLLAVAALVGLAARGLARLLGRAAPTSRMPRRSVAGWLTLRRVARLPAHALTLVTAGGLALGLFVYFAAIAASTGTALDAKSAALAGAETSSRLFTTWRIEPGLPRSMPDDTTFVWRESATVKPGDISVDLLAVDPATFARGAAWRPTFADAPLSDVLAAAGTAPSAGGSTSSVLAVGQTLDGTPLPASGQLVSGGWGAVGFEVADRPEAFPGMRENVPLIVVDARRFFPLIGPYDPTDPETQVNPVRQVFRPEIWSAGSPTDVERYLVSRDTRLLDVQTREQVAARPDLLAPTWALGYLTAVGAAVGCLALGALVVYADQRRAARATSYALARRMGLSASGNLLATAAELLAVLAVALLVGVVAALAVGWVVAGHVDPAPRVAPAPQLEVPLVALAVSAAGVVVSALATAAWLQLRADRTDIAEVLRVAE